MDEPEFAVQDFASDFVPESASEVAPEIPIMGLTVDFVDAFAPRVPVPVQQPGAASAQEAGPSAQRTDPRGQPQNLAQRIDAVAGSPELPDVPDVSDVSEAGGDENQMEVDEPELGEVVTETPRKQKPGDRGYEVYLLEQQQQQAAMKRAQADARAEEKELEIAERLIRAQQRAETINTPADRGTVTQLSEALDALVMQADEAEMVAKKHKVTVKATETPETAAARVAYFQNAADELKIKVASATKALKQARRMLSAADIGQTGNLGTPPAPKKPAAKPAKKPVQAPTLDELRAQRDAARVARDTAKEELQATWQFFPEDSGDEDAREVYEGHRVPAQEELDSAIAQYEAAVSAVNEHKRQSGFLNDDGTPMAQNQGFPPDAQQERRNDEFEFMAQRAEYRISELAAKRAQEDKEKATARAAAQARGVAADRKKAEEAETQRQLARQRLVAQVQRFKAAYMEGGMSEAQAFQSSTELVAKMPAKAGDVGPPLNLKELQTLMGKQPAGPLHKEPAGPSGISTVEKEMDRLRKERDVQAAQIRVLQQEKATAATRMANATGRLQLDALLLEARNALSPAFQTVPAYRPPDLADTNLRPRTLYTDKPLAPQKFTDEVAASCLGPNGNEIARKVVYYYEKYLRDCAARSAEPNVLRVSVGSMLWEGEAAIWFMNFLESCPQDAGWVEGDPRAEPSFATFKEQFMKQWCGKVRTDGQEALESLMSGHMAQGKNSLLQYAQSFMTLRRKLPEESTVSMCKYFLLGMRNELHAKCAVDAIGREWVSLEDLITHATAVEIRINTAKALLNKAASLRYAAAQMDTSEDEETPANKPYLAAIKSDGWEISVAEQRRLRAEEAKAKREKVAAMASTPVSHHEPAFASVAEHTLRLMGPPDNLNPNKYAKFDPLTMVMPWKLADMPDKFPLWLRPASDLLNSQVGRQMGLAPGGQQRGDNNATVRMMLRCWWLCGYCKKRHHFLACPDKGSGVKKDDGGAKYGSGEKRPYVPSKPEERYGRGGRDGGRGFRGGGRFGGRHT